MPITPQFQLSQTGTHVNLEIRVPHVRVSVDSVEILVDGDTVHFASPPYLLILKFPSQFAPTDSGESAKYDPSRDGGMILLEMKKLEPEIWPDLDFLGKLMQPKKSSSIAASPMSIRAEILLEEHFQDEDDNNNTIEQEPLPVNVLDEDKPHYGFLNQWVGVYTDLVREGLASEMLQLPNPDETGASERRSLRLQRENETFGSDRYLGDIDLEDDYIYQTAVTMEPHWAESVDSLANDLSKMSTSEQKELSYYTLEESSMLASIAYPILPSLIDDQQQRSLLLGLLDILFAYVYDHLFTDGDPSIESSWTVSTLSCTLSWLESFGVMDSIHTVICYASRRSLIYPYIRNHAFTNYCWGQVATIVKNGRRCITRCLLQLRAILDKSEFHYLGNKLYLDPYLLWIQSRLDDSTLSNFCKELCATRHASIWIKKDALDLDLLGIEQLLNESPEETTDEEEEGDDDDDDDEAEDDDIVDEKTDCLADLSIGAIVAEDEGFYSRSIAASSALLDSEIGSCGVLKIIEEVEIAASERTSTPSLTGRSLIQEM